MKRRASLKRGEIKRRSKISPYSIKRVLSEEFDDTIKADLVRRSGGRCEVCRVRPGTDRAHIIGRPHGGVWASWCLLWLCRPCHSTDRFDYVHGKLTYILGFESPGTFLKWDGDRSTPPTHCTWSIQRKESKYVEQYEILGCGTIDLRVPEEPVAPAKGE